MEKTNNMVNLAKDPIKKGESFLKIIDILKIGGKTMKDYLKSFSKLQWASLLATLVLLILGICAAFVPELMFIADNLEAYFVLLGLVSAPGIASRGKELGEQVKRVLNSKQRIKEINALVKLAKKELDLIEKDNAYLIPILKRQKDFGGTLTADQDLAKSNYDTQKLAVLTKIDEYNIEKAKLLEEIK